MTVRTAEDFLPINSAHVMSNPPPIRGKKLSLPPREQMKILIKEEAPATRAVALVWGQRMRKGKVKTELCGSDTS